MEARLEDSLTEVIQLSDDAIRSEEDLLDISMTVVGELKSLIGKQFIPAGIIGETVEEVAQLVHALGLKLKVKDNGEIRMKIHELIEQVQKTDPELLKSVGRGHPGAVVGAGQPPGNIQPPARGDR